MRLFTVLGLSAALLAAGCTDPYGRPDPVGTALVGAAVGAAAGLAVAGAFNHPRHDSYAYPRRGYGGYRGYGYQPRYGYGGW